MRRRIAFVIVLAETALEMRSRLGAPVRAGRSAIVVAALLCCMFETTALAHSQARPLETWGPFLLPGTIDCLRLISRATHLCFDTVLMAEQGCRDAQMRGTPCDRDQVDALVDEATRELRATATASCTLGQLTELGYFGFADAALDLNIACADEARAAVATTYAPALAAQPEPSSADCMTATAAYGRKVLNFVLRQKTPLLDRIATRLFTPEEKLELALQVETELIAARARWVTDLQARCPQFTDVYGQTPDRYLRTLKQRADCVLSNTYVTTANFCPAPACGNGVPEPGEECDDGNTDNTDACRADCSVNPSR